MLRSVPEVSRGGGYFALTLSALMTLICRALWTCSPEVLKEPAMIKDFIRVTRRRDGTWAVFRGSQGLVLLAFRLKTHAIAYARAISFSGKLALFVDDKSGNGVRQLSTSLTYPIFLD
jgi:hypothetical protein